MNYLLKCIIWIVFLLSSAWLLEKSWGWENTAFWTTTPFLHFLSVVTPISILILFGVLLGGGHLIKELKADGRWKINFKMMITLGILPLGIVLLLLTFYVEGLVDLGRFNHIYLRNFALILCGYYISHSIHKVKK